MKYKLAICIVCSIFALVVVSCGMTLFVNWPLAVIVGMLAALAVFPVAYGTKRRVR